MSRRGARWLAGPCVALCLATPVSRAQEAPWPDADPGALEGLELDGAAGDAFARELPAGFGNELEAYSAYSALVAGQPVRARELVEQLLAVSPDSISGHCLLGMLLHEADGNMARAVYHLKRCRERFEELHGSEPTAESPWFWHLLALGQLAVVSGEMGRHEDKLRYHDELAAVYGVERPAARAWPLMRLGRLDDARSAALAGIALVDRPEQIETAWTALCAIEGALWRRQASLEACAQAAEVARASGSLSPTNLTNAAEAALGMFRLDDAERWLLDATRLSPAGQLGNPWLELVHLYLAQGRSAEALDALREMFRWQDAQSAGVDVQTRTGADLAAATFLIVAGRPREAARVTARAMERPDRTGEQSADDAETEAAAALIDRVANRTAAELEFETASYSRLPDALAAWARALRHRLRAWSSGRRAAALFVGGGSLAARLAPYHGGAVKVPEWIDLELVSVVGPGVAAATLAAPPLEALPVPGEAYLQVLRVEIAYQRGEWARALELARRSVAALPQSEVLLAALAATRGAQAALALGNEALSTQLLERAFQLDPGAIRRLDAALPVAFEASGSPAAERALALLRASPRLRAANGGFRVQLLERAGELEACLRTRAGVSLQCPRASPRAGDEGDDLSRRLAEQFHAEVFAPRVPLTQADLRSLDGSNVVAGRGGDRLRIVLDRIAQPE